MGFFKTQRLTLEQFNEKYPLAKEALDKSDDMSIPSVPIVGEVNVPGGWVACVLDKKGNVTHVYNEDDGWQEAQRMS